MCCFFESTSAASPGIIENCTVSGNILFKGTSGGAIAGSGSGALRIINTYYEGSKIENTANRAINLFTGVSSAALTIENSGYRVNGMVNTTDAQVLIDDTPVEASQITYNGNNFSVFVPVLKNQAGAIINNTPTSVSFVLNETTETRNLSNAAKTVYNLNVEVIIFEDFEDFTAKTPDDLTDVTQIHSPAYAFLQKEIKTISATVANDVDAILIDVTTAGTSTWKLYADRYCTQEIAPKEMNLSVGENFAYIKVTSGNEKYTKIYDVKITREPKRAQVLTGFTAFFREHEVLFVWDAAYEASVQGYNLYRSTSRGSGYTKIAY
ncbi:MAG: cadherin-like beta sandwich domain-containing protein, partial [Clostridiales bacterium]|nr:cadherin-like beta sandwich domain-containing protein [Clostridiales bacterium]